MSEKQYSKQIADIITGFLTDDDWNYSFDEERGLVRFNLSIKGKIKSIRYVIDIKEDEFVSYAIAPIGADNEDPRQMRKMAEFICRANYGLKNGNFELDFTDGEIRYKSFEDCENVLPSIEMVKNSIYIPSIMFERYGSGIIDMIYGDISPKEAVDKCEED